MTTIKYRLAGLSDVEQLAELRWNFRTETDETSPTIKHEDFLRECRTFLADGLSGSWTYWIAEDDGTILSHAFVQRVPMVPNPNRINDEWGYVTNCYTIPSQRGRGIGTSLMQTIIQWARSIDLELLVVWPSDESIEYYERLGFSKESSIFQLSLR